ncbi:MAG: ABC transporter ATP-binding protein [Fusobacterium sp.]|uniref:ABC transporter ATP-binding protein n=1 Tax=Fusobacterium sp. TaxID=68766 RepID=UPI0026DB6836|nr:ABC transporter ATP-binding protein [Fusobacterium sp.]MDO4689917.1 ABC transporter ATP-binding protein [Fusobacterium sp.]
MKLGIKNLSFSYRDKKVLKNISFEIENGEILGILGPNGAGKSTLIKCINGILRAKDGSVFLENKNLLKMSLKEKSQIIAYVPQLLSVPEIYLTVYETVLLGRAPYKRGNFSEQDRILALKNIEKFGLERYMFSYVEELSGGEKQRVLLARALTQEPKILILDESTSNLDLKYQLETMEIVKDIVRERKLFVLNIIHDLNLAISYSDKILLLKEGELKYIGKTKSIVTKEIIEEIFDVKIDIIDYKNKNYIIPLH